MKLIEQDAVTLVAKLDFAGTIANVFPDNCEPLHGVADQLPEVDVQLPVPAADTVRLSTKVCPLPTGDMFVTFMVFPGVTKAAVPLGGEATETIVNPAGAVSVSELNDELPFGVSFLNVAVTTADDPAGTEPAMFRLNIFC